MGRSANAEQNGAGAASAANVTGGGPEARRGPPSGPPRDHLPIPKRAQVGATPFDAKDAAGAYPPIARLRPPEGAPNVLVVLLDDVGFGAASTFGGPCRTPTADRLATGGLRYNRFHTTALCSPTRAALLSGRNHHTVGMGGITELATSAPGYDSIRPDDCAPLAQTLRLNGYNTAQFGKCHEVPVWETSPVGPFDRWPTGSGFEYFYGFIAGETNQFYPVLYEGTTPIDPPSTPEQGYHFTEDITDKAVTWVQQQKSLNPETPFFVYFAPGATHAPHQVPADWADRYVGQFDDGWDVVRERTFARQKELGVIPMDAELTARPAEIPAWEDMPTDLRGVLARQMEIYAAFLEHTDAHVGRIIDTLDDLGELSNTLVYYIIGDNGASAEGTINGTFNELLSLNGAAHLETAQDMAAHIAEFGTPAAYNHYAVGWAHAMCTPYQWTKQVASHWGGTRNGTVVHWPGGITAGGEVRSQFTHVIDVAPTVLEVAGLPEPSFVDGIQQRPYEGRSMAYSFGDPDAAERHTTQYFEMFCNRGIYHHGWTAVTRHSTPWLFGADLPAFADDVWELYDTTTDWTQAHDLAEQHPDKLRDLQRQFLIEATKYNVLPLDDRRIERLDSDLAGRPTLLSSSSQTLYSGMGRLNENCVLNIKNKSHAVSAQITVPDSGGAGVIVAQGGEFGGWALYLHEGRFRYCYNLFGLQHFKIEAPTPLTPGEHRVGVDFAYDGGGLGRGGTATVYVDGHPEGKGRIEGSVPMLFSADETTDVGQDNASPVSDDYTPAGSRFTGTVRWVRIDLGNDTDDRFITPEQRMAIAIARQ